MYIDLKDLDKTIADAEKEIKATNAKKMRSSDMMIHANDDDPKDSSDLSEKWKKVRPSAENVARNFFRYDDDGSDELANAEYEQIANSNRPYHEKTLKNAIATVKRLRRQIEAKNCIIEALDERLHEKEDEIIGLKFSSIVMSDHIENLHDFIESCVEDDEDDEES